MFKAYQGLNSVSKTQIQVYVPENAANLPTGLALLADGARARMLYAELLLSYPRETVVQWLRSACAHYGTNDVDLFLEKLWKKQARLPVRHEVAFHKELSAWLRTQGLSYADFAQRAYRRFAEQPALCAKQLLLAYQPYMPLFYSTQDQRQMLLKLLAPMHEQECADLRLVYQGVRYGWRRDLVLFMPRGAEAAAAYASFDFASTWLSDLACAPLVLGLPAFEETRLWADQRSAAAILEEASYEGPAPSGYEANLYAYMQDRGFDFTLAELHDAVGWVSDVDVRDERTGALLLRAGCFYGAPCSLAELRYQTALGKVHNPFERLVSHLVAPEYSLWTQLKERHELLLEDLRLASEVVYRHEDDSIALDRQHLMKGVPAKILRNVLRAYVQEGRTEFEYREFKRDEEICMDPLNPNFEGRLQRLIERLKQSTDVLSIEKSRRGAFRLLTARAIRLREEA